MTAVAGVHVRPTADFDKRITPLSAPPRITIEHAAIDVAAEQADTAARFRVLADACQTRRTTAAQLAAALGERARTPHGREIAALLADLGVKVELDGQAFHDNAAARDRDHERDLDTAAEDGGTTIRLTYGQVVTRGCATARKIATVLATRGWSGDFRRCPSCPP